MFPFFENKVEEKKKMRSEVQSLRGKLSKEEIARADEEIRLRLLQLPYFLSAESIFTYVSMEREPDTKEIIDTALAMGKRIFVPRCLPGKEKIMEAVEISSREDLLPGTMGIMEPKKEIAGTETKVFSLMLIPCVSADRRGGRLGHGAGYYDRFLEKTAGSKLCLCYASLLSKKIPMDKQDIFMDYLLTEEELISCRRNR